MCGTPAVALGLGAVPELIDEGVTGCWTDTLEEMPGRLLSSFDLDRRLVRERAVARFSAERMASEYAQLYARIASAPR